MNRSFATGLTILVAALTRPTEAQLPGDDDCPYEAERNVTVDADGAASLRIHAGAGRLVVEGRPGVAVVRVRGRACAREEALLNDIRLLDARDGATIRIEAILPVDRWRWGNDGSSRLDLVVEVPLGIAAEIDDTSGAIELRGLGELTISDDSGAVSAEQITGAIRLRDGSGAIMIRGVGGNVDIDDDSGEIDVDDVAGSVELSDGSGTISVRNVTGSVTVRRDGSGLIRVTDISGDFSVERDGTGEVIYRNIGGTVRQADPEF